MTQLRGEPSLAPDVEDADAVGDVFDALVRLTFSWASRPVTRLYLDRAGVVFEPTHHLVLRYIGVAGPLRLSDLAALANMTPSNASKIVAELVDGGLVVRRVPRDDRRVTLLELTDEGIAALVRLKSIGSAMLAERLAAFSSGEVDDLRGLLVRLADEVEGWASTLGRDATDATAVTARAGGGSSAATEEES